MDEKSYNPKVLKMIIKKLKAQKSGEKTESIGKNGVGKSMNQQLTV